MAGAVMTAGLIAAQTERRLLGTWLTMVGFVFASMWSIMSIFWAQSNPSPLEPESWMLLSSMAVSATVYFGYLGLYGDGLGE